MAMDAQADEAMKVFEEVFGSCESLMGKAFRELDDSICKDKVDCLLANLDSLGLDTDLTRDSYQSIIDGGFRGENLVLAAEIASIVVEHQPLTLRAIFYQVVSAGLKPSTDEIHYKAVGRVLKRLRRLGILPYNWIIDSMRSTVKPSSWSGLTDYIETVQESYRRNFWRDLPNYVHIIVEKDAIAGVLQPVTGVYDVALSPLRGYASDSFVYSIAETWNDIDKPIYVAYLGDRDPSGMDIEQDCKKRLRELCKRDFQWVRLGVNKDHFDEFDLLKLEPKKKDCRYKKFVKEHGAFCAEVDAIPASALRDMVERFILNFVPMNEWERLQQVEQLERETFRSTLKPLLATA